MQIELKCQGEHATFFDLNIKIEDKIFIHKLFDKRDKVPFVTVIFDVSTSVFFEQYSSYNSH